MTTGTLFRALALGDWRQFGEVDIQFHPRLTVLTGANGAGKTTLLKLLSRHTGWSFQFLSTLSKKKGVEEYLSDVYEGRWAREIPRAKDSQTIGRVEYTNDQQGTLWVPLKTGPVYDIQVDGQLQIPGLFIPSHRPNYAYHPVDSIPTKLEPREQLFTNFANTYRQTFNLNLRRQDSPSVRLKSALIALAVFGHGSEAVEANDEALATFKGFEKVLRLVLPETLGFERLKIRVPEVLLETRTGTFSLDGVSGGVASIIDSSWQLYLCSLFNKGFCAIFDEPENHMHPQLQRSLLVNFMTAFPLAQFIVATHNPFIVTSVPDSNVYVLDYDQNNKVNSQLLTASNRAGSSNQVLREVLGVPATIPIWTEKRIEMLVTEHLSGDVTVEGLERLKAGMKEAGIDALFPETVSKKLSAMSAGSGDDS